MGTTTEENPGVVNPASHQQVWKDLIHPFPLVRTGTHPLSRENRQLPGCFLDRDISVTYRGAYVTVV